MYPPPEKNSAPANANRLDPDPAKNGNLTDPHSTCQHFQTDFRCDEKEKGFEDVKQFIIAMFKSEGFLYTLVKSAFKAAVQKTFKRNLVILLYYTVDPHQYFCMTTCHKSRNDIVVVTAFLDLVVLSRSTMISYMIKHLFYHRKRHLYDCITQKDLIENMQIIILCSYLSNIYVG